MIILNLTADTEEVLDDGSVRHVVILSVGSEEVWRSTPTYLDYNDPNTSVLDVVADKLREVFK